MLRSQKGMFCLNRVTVIFSSLTVRLFVILLSIKSISVNTMLLGVPHQPEVCSPGCLGTDCDWVRPISLLIASTVSKISFLSSRLYAKGEQDLGTDLFFNTWLLCILLNLTQLTVKFLRNSSKNLWLTFAKIYFWVKQEANWKGSILGLSTIFPFFL